MTRPIDRVVKTTSCAGALALLFGAAVLSGCASVPAAAGGFSVRPNTDIADTAQVRLAPQAETAGLLSAAYSAGITTSCFEPDEIVDFRGSGRAGGLGGQLSVSAGAVVALHLGMGLTPGLPNARTRAATLGERNQLERKIQDVLERELTGREVDWQIRSTGEQVTFGVGESRSEFKEITIPRNEEVARTPDSFRVETGTYRTVRAAILRPNASPAGTAQVDTIPANRTVTMFGRVRGVYGENWLLVGQDGVGFGYVDAADVEPAQADRPLSPYRRPVSAATGVVLRDAVSATVTCRDLRVSTALGSDSMTACRGADGRWVADLPEGQNRRGACLPTNRRFLVE
jgi:hypothetical protein